MGRPTAEELFDRHHVTIYRFLRRLTGDSTLAEDLTQDLFVKVIRGLETYDSRDRDLAWLFRIARRIVADRRKAGSRTPDLVPSEEEAYPASAPGQVRLGLDEALALLPETECEAFLLREQGGFGYEEIAAIAGATPDAVRNRIHRARTTLRKLLSAGIVRSGITGPREASQ